MNPEESYKSLKQAERVKLPDSTSESSNIYSSVTCPKCASPVSASDLNINDKIAKCGNCDVVFPFHGVIAAFDTTPRKVKKEILRPEGIDEFYYKDEVEFSFAQPYGWVDWSMLIYLIGVAPLGIMIGMANYLKKGMALTPVFVILAFAVPMIYYFYQIQKRHRTIVHLNDRFLSLKMRPKKFQEDQTWNNRDIDQLYVKQQADLGTWEVKMIVDEGKGQKHVVLTSFYAISQAKYLEQEIERYLGIQDVEVPEEAK